MDFFGAQEHARKLSRRLLLMFAASLLGLIVTTNLLLAFLLGVLPGQQESGAASVSVPAADPVIFLLVSGLIIVVVAIASLYKTLSLRGGGRTVAEALGGRLLTNDNSNPQVRRLLNVVEEMAIASGMPVPPVYMLEEDGINAFAAGYSASDAVIGVTRGAVSKLSRDELQGVIAHEFSHILHGDMRLNIRLISLVHGIMVLGMMGYYLMRSASLTRRSKDNGALVLILLGLGLVIIGWAGTFFGRLIKSAISRQREFLADASAVQYTRNPVGIAGALKRIGADGQGSALHNPAAEEISHALFAAGFRSGLAGLFATHPPLAVRIQRLQPDWDGSFAVAPVSSARPPETGSGQQINDKNTNDTGRARAADLLMALPLAMSRIGNPDVNDLTQAAALHHAIPEPLLHAARTPFGARAIVWLLLLEDPEQPTERQEQLEWLEINADPAVFAVLQQLLSLPDALSAELRLPVLNIALGSLHQLTIPQYTHFRANIMALGGREQQPRLSRWLTRTLLLHHLDRVHEHNGLRLMDKPSHSLLQQAQAVSVLLSLLAWLGGSAQAQQAYSRAISYLDMPLDALRPADQLSIRLLDGAVGDLCQLAMAERQRLLLAALHCIHSDGEVNYRERDLLATVAEILDVPLPAAW